MSLKSNTSSLQEILNKINALPEIGGVELPELTNEGTSADLLSGKELIDGDGNVVTGTFTIDEELTTQETLLSDQDAKLAELAEILSNKASVSPVLQSKTITPTTTEQTVTADSGYDGLRAVTVNGDANLIPANIAEGVSIFGVEGCHSGGSHIETCNVTITSVNCPLHEYYATAFTESDGIVPLYANEPISTPTLFTLSNVVCGSIICLKHIMPVTFGYNVTGGAMFVNYEGYYSVFSIPQYPTDAIVITIRDDD